MQRSLLSEKNKQCIFRFANDLLLEGLSKPRIMRYVGTLKMLGEVLDLRYAMEQEEKRKEQEEVRNNADTLMNMLMKDPEMQKVLMEKLAR